MAGDLDRPIRADVDDDDLLVARRGHATRTHTVCPSRVAGTEYWPPSKETIGVVAGTVRVTPNATVCGLGRDRVQPGPFLLEHLDRGAGG